MRYSLLLAAIVLLLLAAPAQAVDSAIAVAGFWAGFVDGLLSLFKLLLSPFAKVSLVGDFGTWSYTVGYYLGVLTFVGLAGAAASSEAVEPGDARWAAGRSPRR